MAFSTKVIVDTSPDFGDNPQETTESGKPASASLQGLIPNTYHWTKAELYEDGSKVATSEVESFQTLQVGSMTIAYSLYRRPACNEHYVQYTYTSTYAPSSAVLHVTSAGGFTANYQGVIDSANNTITFPCNDWEGGGVVYSCTATLTDIYGESQTSAATNVTSATMNTISCAVVSVTETSVTLSIEKCLDGGFSSGRADWWLETDEPDYEPSRGHVNFLETDTTVTITGLTADTEYIFNVSATLTNTHIVVSSAYVNATTAAIDWSKRELAFVPRQVNGQYQATSLWFTSSVYSMTPPQTFTVETSEDGVTWTQRVITPTWNDQSGNKKCTEKICDITAGKPLSIRSNDHFSEKTSVGVSRITKFSYRDATGTMFPDFDLQGNPLSIGYASTFKTQSITPLVSEYSYMFHACSGLVSAENLDISRISSSVEDVMSSMFASCRSMTTPPASISAGAVGRSSLDSMFEGCSSMVSAPDMSGVTSVGENGCRYMFHLCTALTSAPSLESLVNIGEYGCREMFRQCSSMTSAPSLGSLQSIGYSGCIRMFEDCTSLTSPSSVPSLNAVGIAGCNCMYYNCSSLTDGVDLSGVTTMNTESFYECYRGCTSLVRAGSLPSSALTERCFYGMFYGCTALRTAPELPALALAKECYYYMFINCSSLSSITCMATDISASQCTTGWMRDVAASGTFTKNRSMSGWTTGQNGIPLGWTVRNQ